MSNSGSISQHFWGTWENIFAKSKQLSLPFLSTLAPTTIMDLAPRTTKLFKQRLQARTLFITHRGRGGQRGQGSRTIPARSRAQAGVSRSVAITASQVAQEEEDAEIATWETELHQRNEATPSPTSSRAEFLALWRRGGLLSLPPRRPGRQGGPLGVNSL